MALVAHYDLELHQMDVKTAFLNGNIDETIYMVQSENFESNDSKQLVCRLKRSIYGLKQASRQWYRKFDQVITSFGFKENTVDQCIYLKFSGSKFIILVLYVDDILLESSDVGLLHETKRFLSSKFDMKDLGNASFVLGIQIHRDRSRGILGLSQKAYIDKVLSRFGMSNCAPGDTPVAKGDKFSLHQCLKNELEKKDMERFPYASAIGNLMYAQVCTCPDIAYIVGMLGRYLSNPGMDHWKKAKRVMRYLQRTKDYMLTYRRSSHLEIVDIRTPISRDVLIVGDPLQATSSCRIHSLLRSIKPWDMAAEFCHSIVDGIEKPLRITMIIRPQNYILRTAKVSVVGHAAILVAIKKYMPSLDCTLSCTMNGHKSVVSALAVSDGVLYSGSWDGTIRLCASRCSIMKSLAKRGLIWRNDVFMKSIQAHNGVVFAVGMEGKWLFTGGWDKSVNVQVHLQNGVCLAYKHNVDPHPIHRTDATRF
ncbi:Retrovirus-related Pol polyprotein from transposon TNT 1-94 [Vitis vinifera]|uniref:Retrovirus-related Pol polyprotein from transposon TNT 1-94 n=1 Tax=Vitis vinifera TaxID=29760 RepID=A0A438G5I8_VITVI|nr:Retrovirus-related Pol polyprotein from transposon TNT 1-94 [Vitis vinifera]